MSPSSFIGLVQNAALLLSMALIFDVAAPRRGMTGELRDRSIPPQLLLGLVTGLIGLAIMATPWVLVPGIVFDTRSVLLAISGLFFGTVPTLVAMAMTAAYRIFLGGGGAPTGVAVILATGALGIGWRRLCRKTLDSMTWLELYLFGLLAHAIMLALMLTLPRESVVRVLSTISVPVMVIYPAGTALLGILLRNRLRRRGMEEALRQSEAQVALSLREKETLLRELYHRTKNNMQVISSMLELKASSTASDEARLVLRDMGNRIIAMSLVHQMLYRAKDLSHVSFNEYVHELAELLLSSYSAASGRVVLRLELEPTDVLIDVAMPCGLILSELVSNSLKYAFPDGRSGVLRISLRHIGAEEIELEVADDGIGVPPGFDFRNGPTLGLQTVFALAEHQLQGSADFTQGEGLRCRIRFENRFYLARV